MSSYDPAEQNVFSQSHSIVACYFIFSQALIHPSLSLAYVGGNNGTDVKKFDGTAGSSHYLISLKICQSV
jgi:hypothetical protein